MTDRNKDCFTKSKLIITLKTLWKCKDRCRVAAKETNKQTQRHRNWQTFRQKNIFKEKEDILANRHTSRLTVDTCTKRRKQKMKNESLCSAVIEINK